MTDSVRCDPDRMDDLASTLRRTGDHARVLAGRVTEAQILAALPGGSVPRLRAVEDTAHQAGIVVAARARFAAAFTIEPRMAMWLDDRLAAGEVDDELAVPLDALARQRVADARAQLRAAGGRGKGRPTGDDIRSLLAGLTATQLDALVGALTDAEVRAVFHRLRRGSKHGGLSRSDRFALYADLGERVARPTWRRLGSLESEIEPPLATVVARLPKVAVGGRPTTWQVRDLQGPVALGGPGDAAPFDADDLRQGYLGDCYLLSVVQSLAAQHPEALAPLFRRNPNGTVTVQVANGARAVVDPSFVVESNGPGAPMTVQHTAESDAGSSFEIWGQVLEKAWAILHGGYGKIWSGNPGETLVELVGGSVTQRDADGFGADELARRLAAGEILTVLTSPDADDPRLESHHAYRLVAVDPVHRVVTLENPWDAGGSAPFTIPLDDLVRASNVIDANRLPTSGDESWRR